MPRGCRDSNRMKEIGKGTQFRGGSAAEGGTAAINGAKGNDTKKVIATWRETFKQRMTQDRMEKIFDAVCEKAEGGDMQAAAFLRDTMGEKPTDTMEISGGEPFEVNIRVIE